MTWHVLWDNGSDACGEFHYDFDSSDAAETWGEEWLAEFMLDNEVDPDDAELPGFDVIEVAPRVDDGPAAHFIEGTFDHFDRYIGETR